jgi:peptidoglycan/xylan/chitin deacetylase (PgdA/CDA1 family)
MSDGLRHSEGNPERIKVLIYHRVNDDRKVCAEQRYMCVHSGTFRRQLELLERWGYTGITFRDYRLFREGKLNLPRKPIILTFDDGYKEVYDHAFPLLREFGMTAVVFAMADQQMTSNAWDQPLGIPDAPLMEARHLLELHEAGFEIGSHTLSHKPLPTLAKTEAWEEISRSRMLLEILLNAPVESIAYPYGLANEAVKGMVSEAGYLTGVGVYSGPGTFGVDALDFRRIVIPGSLGDAGFALRILTPYQHYASLKWSLKSLLGLSPAHRRASRFASPYAAEGIRVRGGGA